MSVDSASHQPEWLDFHQPSVGRYVLGPILGQGGAGEVREAWDVVLCRCVALKVLRKMEPIGLIRFMHEAQIQSRIVHPNICRIYDVDNSGGVPKIAMQLVRGPTLAQVAHELTVMEVVTLLAQVAEAIHAAHRLQLIHRDLKPSNILLERSQDERWVPLVCDFGLAMALNEPSLTLGEGLIGTPAFMAPEQILGDRRRVGPATDIYALGGTLHYALYGDPPPGGTGPLALRRQGVFSPMRNPTPDLPRDLETILRKCLEPAPEHRYGSALALAEDLWLFRDGAPINARPLGPLELRWRQARKYRTAALAVFLACGAVLAGRLVEKGQLTRREAAQAEVSRSFVLEAADLEKGLRLEKMLPVHDLRPAYANVRHRMEDIRARMRTLGPEAQGPGHYALGRAYSVQRDYSRARQELEQAWDLGFQGPEVAWLLAQSLALEALASDGSGYFATGLPAPDPAEVAQRVQDLFARGQTNDPEMAQYAQALIAYTHEDYSGSATSAHACFVAHPWHYESATLEAADRIALGRQAYAAGDLRGAQRFDRAAMAAANAFLDLGQSDEYIYYLYVHAAGRLACIQASQGRLSMAFVHSILARCAQAQRLDPQEPLILGSTLEFLLLKAWLIRDRGGDPGPDLDSALTLLSRAAKAPLPPELQAERMLLYWTRAEQLFDQGGDPGPDLAQALADLSHTGFFKPRDFYGDVLNFKARVEASRGLDPRPTVAATLARLEPQGALHPWPVCETEAEAWLIRATWETAHGLDARTSLQHCRNLAELALTIGSTSASAHALRGLADLAESKANPAERARLWREARRQLQLARAQSRTGRLQAELAKGLGTPFPNK